MHFGRERVVHLRARIDTKYPFYGSRRVAVELRRGELVVNRKAVQRHMQEMGIAGICPGPNLSKRAQQQAVYPYLLRSVTASYPNQIWGIEIV